MKYFSYQRFSWEQPGTLVFIFVFTTVDQIIIFFNSFSEKQCIEHCVQEQSVFLD